MTGRRRRRLLVRRAGAACGGRGGISLDPAATVDVCTAAGARGAQEEAEDTRLIGVARHC